MSRLRSLAAMLETVPGTDHEHVDDLEVAVLVDAAEDSPPQTLVAKLSVCAECRSRVVSVSKALRVLDLGEETLPAAEPAKSRPVRIRRFWIAGSTIAAAAAVVALLLVPASLKESLVHRDIAITQIAPPRLDEPVFDSGFVTRLNWSAVPTAERYEVVVYDSTGAVLAARFTPDTVLDFRGDSLAVASSLYWLVRAQLAIGRWVASDLTRIGVEPTP